MFHGQKVTFWRLSFFNNKYLLAPSEAGLISNPAPANSTSTVGGGDSPSYSGFFHCLAVFDDQSSPCFNPGSLLLCTESFSTGPSSRVAFGSFCVTTCLPAYFDLEILSSLFHAQVHRYSILNMTKSPLLNKINYPYVPFLGSPLFIYLSIHRLLLVARCQLSSSTMGILLALHLSRQHITVYVY